MRARASVAGNAFTAPALLVLVTGLALLTAEPAVAHTRSVSYSSWKLSDAGAEVQVRIPLLELSRLAFDPVFDVGSGGRAGHYLAEHLRLVAGDEPCETTGPPLALPAPKGWAHFRWQVACHGGGGSAVESRVLLDVAPSHLHFARIARGSEEAQERVLTEALPRWSFQAPVGAGEASPDRSGTSLAGYIALGAQHILSGWDHLAFVLALLLLAGTFGEVAGLVTAFTLAHSVTLGLAVLGWVRPDGAAVEALIGYSIALVAAENAWLLAGRGRVVPMATVLFTLALALAALAGFGALGSLVLVGLALFAGCHFALLDRVARPARLRAAVAFAFGLVHGFGFAGVLAEMELPTSRLAPALFGFNVGVELGQLGVLLLVWPALRWLASRSPARWQPLVAELGSAAICGLGLYWFVSRTLA